MFERILVAFDGTPESRRAAHVALEIAARFGSHVTVAIVRPPSEAPVGDRLEDLVPIDSEGRSLSMLLDELKAEGRKKQVVALESVHLRGDVVPSLLDYLHRNPQDLTITGSRGLSRGRRILQGSVSSGLVNDAPCPVLVVRPGRGSHRG